VNEREYHIMYQVEERHWWYVALHELIARLVAGEAEARGRLAILDAGCGTGRLASLLQRYGEVRGCDLSPLALAYSRRRGVEAFAADLNSDDLGAGRYDLITAIDVLYHRAVVAEGAVLASLHRALRPGGLLLINVPAHELLRGSHDLAVHTRRRYTRRELLPLLRQAGFTVEWSTYRLGFLFAPLALWRLAKRLLSAGAEPGEVASDVHLPAAPLNRLLLALARAENRLLLRRPLPLGTSLFVVARRPVGEGGR